MKAHKNHSYLKGLRSILLSFAVGTSSPAWSQTTRPGNGDPADSNFLPAVVLQLTDQSGQRPETSIAILRVEADQEIHFVRTLTNPSLPQSSDPTIVIAKQGGPVADELQDPSTQSRDDVKFTALIMNDEMSQLAEEAGRLQSEPNQTSESRFTLKGMNQAGWWIAISVTGIYSIVFYLSSDLGPFASATALVLALQIINAKWPNFYAKRILGTGAKLGEKWARSMKARGLSVSDRTGEEIGRIYSALAYSFVINSGFKLALSWFDLNATFGSLAAIAETASNAAFGFISSDVWNVFVSRNLGRVTGDLNNPDPEEERVLMANRMLLFTRQIISASMGPFLYFGATHNMAISVLGTLGAVGFLANLHGKPFLKTADFVLSKMERSKSVRQVFAKMVDVQKRAQSALTDAVSPVRGGVEAGLTKLNLAAKFCSDHLVSVR